PSTIPLESYKTLRGADRDRWGAEVVAAAERSALMPAAQEAFCLLFSSPEACEQAMHSWREFDRLHPGEGEARRREIGVAVVLLGARLLKHEPAAAEEWFQKALDFAPRSAEVEAELGGALLASDPTRARALFEQAL